MIRVVVDKGSELMWVQQILESGSEHCDYPHFLRALGIDLQQHVHFDKTEGYVDDISETSKELMSQFDGKTNMEYVEWVLGKRYQKSGNYDAPDIDDTKPTMKSSIANKRTYGNHASTILYDEYIGRKSHEDEGGSEND